MCASNLIATAILVIVPLNWLFKSSLLLSSRIDMHSRIRFIFAIVASIVGNKIEKWREWLNADKANERKRRKTKEKKSESKW